MTDKPSATIVIPTRARAGYLDGALASIAPQAAAHGAEVLVVSDGPDPDTVLVSERHGARLLALATPRGANACRNAGLRAAAAELIVLVDDDVVAPDGWLASYLEAAASHPQIDLFGGPIKPVLEDGPRACGREPAPITSLQLGDCDHETEHVWSANMALRRTALTLAGEFDESLAGRGEEEEWEDRLRAAGGRILYLAAAGLEHHRNAHDARLQRLMIASFQLGRTARSFDVRKQRAPSLAAELRDLAGAMFHTVNNRCAYGLVFAAHAIGRLQQTLAPVSPADRPGETEQLAPQDDFLSGQSGYVAGIRATSAARVSDVLADGTGLLQRRRLRRDADAWGTPRRVLVLAVERTDVPNLLDASVAELRRSRHAVEVARIDAGDRGKYENFNLLLAGRNPDSFDWLLMLDDDVRLPPGFLDQFLFLAERFELSLVQPAHRAFSHAAWVVTRRRLRSAVRETRFVELGPVTAFHHRTFATLLPFPPLRAGWGLDAHWSALAAANDWRIGVVDATPIEHVLRPVASSYNHQGAVQEAREFLANRPYVAAADARRVRAIHHSW